MSASDLVPRVVLLVTDLERENAALKLQLKEQEDERLLVQITGPKRTPIYHESSLKNGVYCPGGTAWIHFADECNNNNNNNNNDNLVPLSLVIDSEVWLGGILIETFQDVDRFFWRNDRYFHIYPEVGLTGPGSALYTGGRSPIACVEASIIGPTMTDMELSNLTSEQLPFNLKEQLAVHDDLHLKIGAIDFRKKNISGAMSLLKKLGIRTS